MDVSGIECLVGSILVPDFANPRPQDVDVPFMRYRMGEIVRFSGHPAALTLAEHHQLVALLAAVGGLDDEVVAWCGHHDCHEYATGDIVRPMKRLLGSARLDELQQRWDVAIAGALGLPVPTVEVRDQVAIMDQIAMGLEWRFALGRDLDGVGIDRDLFPLCEEPAALYEVLSPYRRAEIQQARLAFPPQG